MVQKQKRIFKYTALVFAFVLFASGCSLFGSSSSEPVPDGLSDVLGVVRYIDDFSGEGLDVELAGETVTAGEGGSFAFTDVENGEHTLKVYRNNNVVGERAVVVSDDIAGLTVEIGESIFHNPGFEDPIADPFPSSPGSRQDFNWNANRALDTSKLGEYKKYEVTVDDKVARNGYRSVKVYGERVNGGDMPKMTLRQYGLALEEGATYRMTGYFKTDSVVNDPSEQPVYFRLRFYETGSTARTVNAGNDLENVVVAPSEEYIGGSGQFVIAYPESYDDEWNRLYIEFVTPEGSDSVLLEATLKEAWDGLDSATLWWDDITLIRVE